MKFSFLFYLVFYSLIIHGQTITKQVWVEFSVFDCLNCSSNLSRIESLQKIEGLIIKKEYQADSVAIINRYGLTAYADRIVWADTFFSASSVSGLASWIHITNNDSLIFTEKLKAVQVDELQKILSENCLYPFSKHYSITRLKTYFKAHQFITNEFKLLDLNQQSVSELKYPLNLFDTIYLSKLRDTGLFQITKRVVKNNPFLKSDMVDIIEGNSQAIYGVYTTLRIDEIMNEADTVFDKQASLVPLNKMGNDIILIDYKTIPKDYSILPEQLYWHDNYLYAGVYINSSYSKSKQYLIRLKKNNANCFVFDSAMPYQLDDYLIRFNINTQFFNLIFNHGFVAMSLGKTIYNTQTGESLALPFPDSFFVSNQYCVERQKLNYSLDDFHIHSKNNTMTLFYSWQDATYIAMYDWKKRKWLMNKIWKTFDDVKNEGIISYSLSLDGQSISFMHHAGHCVSEISIHSL